MFLIPKLMICVVVMLVKIQSFQDQYIQHKYPGCQTFFSLKERKTSGIQGTA